jgi:cellobiose transport system permease protein
MVDAMLQTRSVGGPKPRRLPGKKRNRTAKIAPYVFISPYFFIYIAFSLFPIIYTFAISLNDWNGFNNPVYVGAKNYLALLKDERFFGALKNTLLFMAMIIPIQIVLGLVVAVILSSRKMVFKHGYRLLNFLPYLTTPIALGVIFGLMFDPQFGSINAILSGLGLIKDNINWMAEAWPARIMVSLITIWKYYGYTSILFLAGITNINPVLYEAADMDGANPFQRFFSITLPQLKPVTVFIVLTTMIGCFQIFEEPFMLFTAGQGAVIVGGPDNSCLSGIWLVYDTAFGNVMRFGYGSSISYGLFVFIAVMAMIANKLMTRGEDR